MESLYFIANCNSIYAALSDGICCGHRCNREIFPITSDSILQVDEEGNEHSAIAIHIDHYVQLFSTCADYLQDWQGSFHELYIIELDADKILNQPSVLRIRPLTEELAAVQCMVKSVVDVAYILKVHAFSGFSKKKLTMAFQGRLRFAVHITPSLFTRNLSSFESQTEKNFKILVEADLSSSQIAPTTCTVVQKGNIFNSKMQAIVNTVNCVGVMGAGLALAFKKKYPAMFEEYREKCARKEVQLGRPYCYYFPSGKQIVNFPTKGHWRDESRLNTVEEGLQYFVKNFQQWGVTSVAMPSLGCGCGKLNVEEVLPLMLKYLRPIGIPVEIYAAPNGSSFPKHRDKRVKREE